MREEGDTMVPMREFGYRIVGEMLNELLGRKKKFDDVELKNVVCSVTLENVRQYDGWDIRVSIGPPGSFENKDDDDNGARQ